MTVEGSGPVGPVSLTQLLRLGSGGMVGGSVAAVRDLVRALDEAGTFASFDNTGGGCMAIRVTFGPVTKIDGYDSSAYEILIVNRSDTFDRADYDSDGNVFGFNAGLYFYGPDGERTLDDSVLVYETAQDAGNALDWHEEGRSDRLVDLPAEVAACVKAVKAIVALVTIATVRGRSDDAGEWQLLW